LKYNQVAVAAGSGLVYAALGFTADGLITEKKKSGYATTVIKLALDLGGVRHQNEHQNQRQHQRQRQQHQQARVSIWPP
jgi:hypothetical protein